MKKLTRQAKAIREIRKNLGLEQKEFAGYVGMSLSHLQALEQGVRAVTNEVAGKIYTATGKNPEWTSRQLKAFNCGQRAVRRSDVVSNDPLKCSRYFAQLLEVLFTAALKRQSEIGRKIKIPRIEQVGRQLSCDLHEIARKYDLESTIKDEMLARKNKLVTHPFYGIYIEEIDHEWKWLFRQPLNDKETKSSPPAAPRRG
jgi:transcriptional regulator with XRE-family HTH domain